MQQGRELQGRGDLDSHGREGFCIYSALFPDLPQSHHNSMLSFPSYGNQITIAYSINGFLILIIDKIPNPDHHWGECYDLQDALKTKPMAS